MNSIRLNKLQFDEWVKVIQKSGGTVIFFNKAPQEIIKHFRINNAAAAFQADAIPPTIWVRQGQVSDLEIFHKSMHFEDFLKRGKENYMRGKERSTKEVIGIGAKKQIPKIDQLISKYVLDKVIEEQLFWKKKYEHGRFSSGDMAHSILYVEGIRKECILKGIDTEILDNKLQNRYNK